MSSIAMMELGGTNSPNYREIPVVTADLVSDDDFDDEFATNLPIAGSVLANSSPSYWKIGLCGCFHAGCCNVMLWLSCLCSPVALGRVMTRLELTTCGVESMPSTTTDRRSFICSTFLCHLVLFLAVVAFSSILYSMRAFYGYIDGFSNVTIPKSMAFLFEIQGKVHFAYVVFVIYCMMRTRRHLRTKYQLPGGCCEDCCRSFCLPCCTVMQMSLQSPDRDPWHNSCC